MSFIKESCVQIGIKDAKTNKFSKVLYVEVDVPEVTKQQLVDTLVKEGEILSHVYQLETPEAIQKAKSKPFSSLIIK